MDRSIRSCPGGAKRGFTLVELLVVIGIIAVLISILLPTLSGVRQRAQTVKCSAHLRSIGQAFRLYANAHGGFFPPSQLQTASGSYNIEGDNFTQAYWTNFIARFVTSAKVGLASGSDAVAAGYAHRSIVWGCPSWAGYNTGAVGGLNRVQTGYGMNFYPTFAADKYVNSAPPNSERNYITGWNASNPNAATGRFMRATAYDRNAAEKMLVADSLYWAAISNPPPADGTFPPQPNLGQNNSGLGTFTPGVSGQTGVEIYRHGKTPPPGPHAFTYAARGGNPAFNILYVDGHVSTSTEIREAYRAIRMKHPG